MSAIATTINSNTVSPFRWIRDEFKYRVHDLSDRVKSLGRFTLEKLKSLKPISRDFKQKMASPGGMATEYFYQNGLRIFHIHDKKAKRSTVELTIQLPQTKEKIPGTNHFLEHMLAESPLGPLKKDMETWSAENGVTFDAATSQDKMFFTFTCEPDKLKPVLEFLATLYQEKPIDYDTKVLEGERDVIQKERQGRENTPIRAIAFKIQEFLKGKTHYSTKNVLGSQKDINSIQPEHLEDARKYFNIADSRLSINSASKLADSLIHQCFKDIKAKPKNERTPVNYSELSPESKQVFKHHDLSDALSMHFSPNPEKLLKSNLSKLDKLRLSGVLLYSLLNGSDSRLQKLFKEKHINAGKTLIAFDHEGRGSFDIHISHTDKKYFPQILSLVREELERIVKEGLSREELNLIKKMHENGLEYLKENPVEEYRNAIGAALSLEHDNWLDFATGLELKDFWEKITKDDEAVSAFNKQMKEFLDVYFISGKAKTVETHHDRNSNVSNFSSGTSTNSGEMKTESHYRRPVPESFNKPGFLRLPARLASVSKLDERAYLVKDREAKIARVYVINENGMADLDDSILKSNDKDLIMQESYRRGVLEALALLIFSGTLGAEDHLRPEKLHESAKKLGSVFGFDTEAKILTFSIGGVKSGVKEMLDLVKQMFSNPAILASDSKSKSEAERIFHQAIESRLKFLEEIKHDRDSMVSREFYNTVLEGDAERLDLDPESKARILKSIKLDDVRKFFKENFLFDSNLKILLNNPALEAGLDSKSIASALMALNQNDKNKLRAKEVPKSKFLEQPPVKKLEMKTDLDKTTAQMILGNLSDDLSKLSVKDRYLLADSIEILHGGITGNLGARLREKGIYHWGLDCSLPSENLGKIHTPQSVFAVHCNCDPSQVDEIKQLIKVTLQEYLNEGPKLEELMRLRHLENSSMADGLQVAENRQKFFNVAFKRNRSPNAALKLMNAPSCDIERAKQLLRMLIKPDNFIEAVDIPKSAQKAARTLVKHKVSSVAALAELPAAA